MSKDRTTARKPAAKKAKRLPAELKINRRREWRLELPLVAEIEGRLPEGRAFKEETRLENISSTGAYFCLDSGVVVGSKLNLVLELPKELTEGRLLKMRLGGITVRLEKPDKRSKKQGVAVRFNRDFRVIPARKKS